LAANNPEMEMTFTDFIDAIDEDYSIIATFQKFLKQEIEKQNIFITDTDIKKKS
jgi:hypothetical protein